MKNNLSLQNIKEIIYKFYEKNNLKYDLNENINKTINNTIFNKNTIKEYLNFL